MGSSFPTLVRRDELANDLKREMAAMPAPSAASEYDSAAGTFRGSLQLDLASGRWRYTPLHSTPQQPETGQIDSRGFADWLASLPRPSELALRASEGLQEVAGAVVQAVEGTGNKIGEGLRSAVGAPEPPQPFTRPRIGEGAQAPWWQNGLTPDDVMQRPESAVASGLAEAAKAGQGFDPAHQPQQAAAMHAGATGPTPTSYSQELEKTGVDPLSANLAGLVASAATDPTSAIGGEPASIATKGAALAAAAGGLRKVGTEAAEQAPKAARAAGRLLNAAGEVLGEGAVRPSLVVPGREAMGATEIVGPAGQVLSSVGEALDLPNLAKAAPSAEVRGLVERTAAQVPDLLGPLRRGEVTRDGILSDLAGTLGTTPQALGASKAGKLLSDAELLALKATLDDKLSTLARLGEQAGEAVTPEAVKQTGEVVDLLATVGRLTPKQHAAAQRALASPRIAEELVDHVRRLGQTEPDALGRFLGGLSVGWWDRLSVLRYGSMLSATSTHLTNSLSNLGQVGLDIALKPLAVGLDAARAGVGIGDKQRTRYIAELAPQVRGTLEGALTGFKEAGQVLRTGLTPSDATKLETRPGFAFGQTAAGRAIGERASGAVDLAAELPLRLLTASDLIFRGAARGGEVWAAATRLAIREGLKGEARTARAAEIVANITSHPKLLAEAEAKAARVVLQERRPLTDWLTKSRDVPGVRYVSEIVMPFVRTPVNIVAQGLGMTPAGVAGVVGSARAGRTGEAVDRVARVLFGSAVLGVATSAAAQGYITGPYPEDQAERSTLPPGWQPWSLRLPTSDGGARYVSFSNLGPIGIPFALAALYGERIRRGESLADLGTHAQAALGLARFMSDSIFLRGIGDALKALEQPERYGEALVENMATQFVPYGSLQRQITRALDMGQRDPRGAWEAVLALNPLTVNQVPERLTPLGDVARQEPSGLAAFVSPLRVTTERDEPALRALRDAGLGIPAAPRTVKGIPLDEGQSREAQKLAGQYIRQWVAPLADDPSFTALPADARRVVLQRLRDAARDAAGAQVLGGASAAPATQPGQNIDGR